MLIKKYAISNALSTISDIASISTWFLVIFYFICSGNHGLSWLLPYASCLSAIAIGMTIIFDEIACKINSWGRGILGTTACLTALFGIMVTIYGNIVNSPDIIAAGVIGLMLLSFVPAIIDSLGIGSKKRRAQHKAMQNAYKHREIRGGGYDQLADAFGIPQPKPLPPIEITRDQDYDDLNGEFSTMNGKTLVVEQADDTSELIDEILAASRNETLTPAITREIVLQDLQEEDTELKDTSESLNVTNDPLVIQNPENQNRKTMND